MKNTNYMRDLMLTVTHSALTPGQAKLSSKKRRQIQTSFWKLPSLTKVTMNAATTPTSTATSTWLTKAILSLSSSMIPTLTPAAPGIPWTTLCEKAKSSLKFNGGI